MVRALLVRGMLAGILAGFLAFGFLKVAGEPSVDRAIAFEAQMEAARDKAAAAPATAGMAMPMEAPAEELVSRPVQSGIGLLTGVMVYSVAFGGLFGLAFAAVYGRVGRLDPRATAALLGICGFVAVSLVPCLVYPANPPSIGRPETIGLRTALYFASVALSLAALIAAGMLRRRLVAPLGGWNAALLAGGVYLAAMLAMGMLLPGVNEVPGGFPAVVLWQFRVASLGAQALMWAVLGLGFGVLAERAMTPAARTRLRPA